MHKWPGRALGTSRRPGPFQPFSLAQLHLCRMMDEHPSQKGSLAKQAADVQMHLGLLVWACIAFSQMSTCGKHIWPSGQHTCTWPLQGQVLPA